MPVVAIFYKWLLLSILPYGLFSGATESKVLKHPFYVSITEINHNVKEQSLEISTKIFTDDLEQTLKQRYKTPVDLSSDKQKQQIDRFITEYVRQHLALQVDGKSVPLQYVGFEKENEAVYCYFEVKGIKTAKTIVCSNSLLYDFTDKEINILHVTVNGNRQSTRLNYPDKTASLHF